MPSASARPAGIRPSAAALKRPASRPARALASGSPSCRRAAAAPALDDHVDDQADDRGDHEVVEYLEVVAPLFPVVADGSPDQGEAEHPGERAERGQPGEAPEGHLRRRPAGSEMKARTSGSSAGEEDGRVAVALEPVVDPGQVRGADVDQLVLLEQVDAAVVADRVGRARSRPCCRPARRATTPSSVWSPLETLKPANSITASLGIGMQALPAAISRKTPASPVLFDHVDAEIDDRAGRRVGRWRGMEQCSESGASVERGAGTATKLASAPCAG